MITAILFSILAQSSWTLIDQVVVVVDKEALTESELMTEARISLISREGRIGLHLAEGPLDAELLAATRDYVVNQILIDNHVRRLGAAEVSTEQVDQALERFADTFPSRAAYDAYLRRYGISQETIRDIIRRDLSNEFYINQRLRAWTAGSRTPQEGKARAQKALKRWLEDLRKNAEIRVLGPTGELERR